uniref:Putative HTLV-1-related endogenous sequence n=1 Tax=Homo sapiens TaxID=9606 RepID=HRES1_HUMAN|nr:RecName: Full=Putative HTLV-1-related endogenous sequence; AltName: Full=p25 [Homo sapiens]CAA34646.1 p25 protein [Homo sapiens]
MRCAHAPAPRTRYPTRAPSGPRPPSRSQAQTPPRSVPRLRPRHRHPQDPRSPGPAPRHRRPPRPDPRAPPARASYRRFRTWPSATSWERRRLSPGHRALARGPPARLGGEGPGAGDRRREGPDRSPRQPPVLPAAAAQPDSSSAQAPGPSTLRPAATARRKRRWATRGPAHPAFARAHGEAGAGRVRTSARAGSTCAGWALWRCALRWAERQVGALGAESRFP